MWSCGFRCSFGSVGGSSWGVRFAFHGSSGWPFQSPKPQIPSTKPKTSNPNRKTQNATSKKKSPKGWGSCGELWASVWLLWGQNFQDAPHGNAIFFKIFRRLHTGARFLKMFRMLRTGVQFSRKFSGCSARERDFEQQSPESYTNPIPEAPAKYLPLEPRKPPRTSSFSIV